MTKIHSIFLILLLAINMESLAQSFHMPAETDAHEGTWLQWPHQHEYGMAYRNRLDPSWVAMTGALVASEKVHIVAYNATEQTRIINLLTDAGIDMTNIDFKVFQTNDVWVRDNGPIFVKDTDEALHILDWGFNGWGGDYNFELCDPIPTSIGNSIGMPVADLNDLMTIEGGSFNIDGQGVFMACKSSIISQSPASSVRNPGMSQSEAEAILGPYLGITKFIWLDGYTGSEDVTDAHIDGFAMFANDNTIVTMDEEDLIYWELSTEDIATLFAASDINNVEYNKVYVPLTQNNVVTTYGYNLGYKGSYVNYYIANTVVLVPNYDDPNDETANAIIQSVHPDKTVIGIDMRNLYANGGMVHCVTQQQPAASSGNAVSDRNVLKGAEIRNYPNPLIDRTTITFALESKSDIAIQLYNALGELVMTEQRKSLSKGNHSVTIDASNLTGGMYQYRLVGNHGMIGHGKMMVAKP